MPGGALPKKCFHCGRVHTFEEPYCFIQPLREVLPAKRVRYIFYDIETSQDTEMTLDGGELVGKHEALLLIAEVVCDECMNAGNYAGEIRQAPRCVCGVFGPRFRHRYRMLEEGNRRLLAFHSFDNEAQNPVNSFLDFLQNSGARNILTVIVAHNGGKFDHHMVLEKLYERGERPTLVTTGLKIFSMTIGGQSKRRLVFKDSVNFFASSLADLWKTYELGDDGIAHKPFFPYHFIRRQNLDKRMPTLPPPSDYGVVHMKPAEALRFNHWYEENRATEFCLRDQLIVYCRNDVEILRAACLKFRNELRGITQKVDPFVSASTIAGLSMQVFRAEFLRPSTLVNLPEEGINKRGRQSIAALKFFKLLEATLGWEIRTAEWAIGEAKLDDTGHRIDGLVIRPNQRPLALEFNGCYYHGCRQCFFDRNMKLAGGRTADELYERTIQRAQLLEQRGYRVISVWECAFRQKLRQNPALARAYIECFVAEPLNPRRDALRGGRTEPFRLYVRAAEDEQIVWCDIVSLYPSVMKNGQFPVGLPQLITPELIRQMAPATPWTRPEQNPFLGVLKCRVLPPYRMRPYDELPPLLPYRDPDAKLVFPLCAKCADKQNVGKCSHSDLQRSWVAGFTHFELNKALELGYKVLEVFEVEHYPATQWALRASGTGLFDRQINTFLKLKVEASGWPADIQTAEQRQRFLDEYRELEGIELDESRIHPNGGLKHLSKLLLNSAWGKLCQRPDTSTVKLTTTPAEFHKVIFNPAFRIIEYAHINEHLDRIVYKSKKALQRSPKTNNVTIAVFVTSQARLTLYSYFEEAIANGAKLIYCDTDSLMALQKRGRPIISMGSRLGQMQKELVGRRIVEVIVAGPKNYTIRHTNETGEDLQEIIKIRGFNLTQSARRSLGFDTIRKLVFKKFGTPDIQERLDIAGAEPPVIRFPQICRDKRANIFTRMARKRYGVVFNKGIVVENFECRPFGYFRD